MLEHICIALLLFNWHWFRHWLAYIISSCVRGTSGQPSPQVTAFELASLKHLSLLYGAPATHAVRPEQTIIKKQHLNKARGNDLILGFIWKSISCEVCFIQLLALYRQGTNSDSHIQDGPIIVLTHVVSILGPLFDKKSFQLRFCNSSKRHCY